MGVTASLLGAVTALVAVVLLWPSDRGETGIGGAGTAETGATGRPAPRGPERYLGQSTRKPRTGAPVEVSTQDGFRYRLAGVTAGSGPGAVPTLNSSAPPGTTFAGAEYVLSNPTRGQVILDFPGDVFIKRSLLPAQSRGRCMWQPGVPTTMCTPPSRSRVVARLAGGAPVVRDGDRYMPPGASYLIRVTIDLPVHKRISRSDMRLYVWKQIFMADQLAKAIPFPS